MKKLQLEWMFERSHNHAQDEDLVKLLDYAGFESILIRTGSIFPDPWVVATNYAAKSRKIKFLIAVNPAMVHPVYCATQISTFQKLFGNRVSINVVSGASKSEQKVFSDSTPISMRYQRSGEFAQIIRNLVTIGSVNFKGDFYDLCNVDIIPGEDFEIVFAGSSDNTIELANSFGNAHLYAMESTAQYIENRHKIKVDSSIKATIIVESNKSKAWDTANDLLGYATDAHISALKEDLSDHESENQKHQQALHNFSKDNLNVEESIWSGLGLLRGGGITAMVGDYEAVADLIHKFYLNGLNRLLIAGTPELYYAQNFIHGVMPILNSKGII
jgi:alkanesulfonate monooxygenase